MMPHTVPSSPMKGDTVAVVASQFMLRSRRVTSSLMPSCRVRSSAFTLVIRPPRRHLPRDFAVAEIEHRHQRRAAELLHRGVHRVQARGLSERAQEPGVGVARAPEGAQLGKEDGPGS